jgi:hypothetical protein
VESADSVVPEHLKIVINRNNEYRRLIEKSVEKLLKRGRYFVVFCSLKISNAVGM